MLNFWTMLENGFIQNHSPDSRLSVFCIHRWRNTETKTIYTMHYNKMDHGCNKIRPKPKPTDSFRIATKGKGDLFVWLARMVVHSDLM